MSYKIAECAVGVILFAVLFFAVNWVISETVEHFTP